MRSENAIKTKLHGYFLDETSIFPETQLTIRIQYASSIRPLKNKKIINSELFRVQKIEYSIVFEVVSLRNSFLMLIPG